LLVALLMTITVTPFYLPVMLNMVGLRVPTRWHAVTLTVVGLTVGAWTGTVLTSIARVIVWLRLKLAATTGVEWERERDDVLAIQRLSLWLLGLLTFLSAALTQWFGEDFG